MSWLLSDIIKHSSRHLSSSIITLPIKTKALKNLVFAFVQSKQLQCDDNNYLGVPAVVAVEEIDATTTA